MSSKSSALWAVADMKDTIPSKEELRHALEERVDPALLRRLSDATVAICGLGGLGSNIAVSLARAGVGHLLLIDFDTVDITNLNRQQYTLSQLGQPKPLALADNLRAINPYLDLRPCTERITEENLCRLLEQADVVCEALDRADQKSLLVNGVLEQLPQAYLVAASGMAGLGDPNTIRTRKITNHFYLCGDGVSDVDTLGSLFAPRVMLCAAHQSLTVLRILAGDTADSQNL